MKNAIYMLAFIAATTSLSACSVSIDDNGYRTHPHHAMHDELSREQLYITIRRAAENRDDAARKMDMYISALRDKSCVITTAKGWQILSTDSHGDIRGFHLKANCPDSSPLF